MFLYYSLLLLYQKKFWQKTWYFAPSDYTLPYEKAFPDSIFDILYHPSSQFCWEKFDCRWDTDDVFLWTFPKSHSRNQ